MIITMKTSFYSPVSSLKINQLVDAQTVRKTLNEWQDIMLTVLSLSNIDQSKSLFDRQLFEDCLEVYSYIDMALDFQDGTRVVFQIQDEHENTQAIAALIINLDHVCLSALVSAPWNLKYKSDITALDLPKRTKGAGSLAFAEAIDITRKLGKAELRTSPLSRSVNFYIERGMKYDEIGRFYFI